MFYTTLNRIREHNPCVVGWHKLLSSLYKVNADDEPLSMLQIINSNGFDDAIWALRCIDDCPEIRLFAVRCARQVQHFSQNEHTAYLLDVAERYAIGEATEEERLYARGLIDATMLNSVWETTVDNPCMAAQITMYTAVRELARYTLGNGTCVIDDTSCATIEMLYEIEFAERKRQEDDFCAIFCSND